MSYEKQKFQTGQTLFASQLNAMDEQIAANETAIQEKVGEEQLQTALNEAVENAVQEAKTGTVSYQQAQELTEEQKQQARENIDAADAESITEEVNTAVKNAMEGQAGAASGSAENTVYCWGDSLTEGVGGWVQTKEQIQNTIVSAYPDVVAKRFRCVNLGCRGETIQTIMARQGADPMVVGGFTIPADASQDVVVGYLRGSYYSDDRLGIATKSGDVAQPMEGSEAGINPCVLAGVEGELYRDMVKDESGRYAYRFRRLKSGEAVDVPEGTELETYAMRFYRNGVAVIWMGANGAVSSHAEYIQKIKDMVVYGKYKNYLVIIAREYTSQWVLEDANSIEKALTDEDGVCHLLYLPPLLLRRGYALAGILSSAGVPDTSSWSTTDALKKNAPLLMYSSGGSEENSFETLHFSCYGYKAIGKLALERLETLIGTDTSGSGQEPDEPVEDIGYVKNGTDAFGAYAYKLTRAMTGAGSAVNTQVCLYDTEKDWTIACRFSEDMVVSDGALGCVFESIKYFSEDAVQTAVYLRLIQQEDGTFNYSFAGGFGGFNFPFDNNSGYTEPTDGFHTAVIAKQAGNYSFYLDGALAYNCALGYAVTEDHLHNEPLYLFGRVDNGTELHTISGIMDDFRVYNSYLDNTAVNKLLTEMNG